MSKGQKDNKSLTKNDIEMFRALLLDKRNELLGNFSYMEKDALREDRSDLSNMPIHMADLGTDSYEQEFTLGLMDSERKLIAEIDEALERIEQGTYGKCQVNGEPIPKPRLEAIPWARYCVACASLMEKRGNKNEDSSNKYTFPNDAEDEDDSDMEDIKKVS
ncbi:MAG: TraR/DksA C4-type zinc finger protein [Sedimentisphaerales bacterium]|nr:TraR/DksA C4-type zinc finger protein [Sedimentisphaerales bacterium]